jgi:DNA topoisomerase 2-associated protein PAT1
MDLHALSACLVAIVCSSEQPPFWPLGSPAGDGATVILKCLLERASKLLHGPQASPNCGMPNFALQQASFDEFFDLLMKYCLIKYDTILQSVYAKTPPSAEGIDSEVRAATKREMPVELLRACLPHTNERQMELLRHFGQQRNTITGLSAHPGNGGHINSESVRS